MASSGCTFGLMAGLAASLLAGLAAGCSGSSDGETVTVSPDGTLVVTTTAPGRLATVSEQDEAQSLAGQIAAGNKQVADLNDRERRLVASLWIATRKAKK